MNSGKKTTGMDMKSKLSSLWIVVMFNMVFADILTFMMPGFLKDVMTESMAIKVTQELFLVFAVLLEIPIIMIFLSRILKVQVNRIVNIIASVITILFVIGGGSAYLHYIFFAAIEVLCMLLIIWLAWKWPATETASGN